MGLPHNLKIKFFLEDTNELVLEIEDLMPTPYEGDLITLNGVDYLVESTKMKVQSIVSQPPIGNAMNSFKIELDVIISEV